MHVTSCGFCNGQSSSGCKHCNPGTNWATIPIQVSTPQQGWECPKCKQVFSPLLHKCDTCGKV